MRKLHSHLIALPLSGTYRGGRARHPSSIDGPSHRLKPLDLPIIARFKLSCHAQRNGRSSRSGLGQLLIRGWRDRTGAGQDARQDMHDCLAASSQRAGLELCRSSTSGMGPPRFAHLGSTGPEGCRDLAAAGGDADAHAAGTIREVDDGVSGLVRDTDAVEAELGIAAE